MSRPNSAFPGLSSATSQTFNPNLQGFVFTDKLGSGTYATVYKAYRKIGARQVVAIKCVSRSTLNKTASENLLREIELLKNLKHEHIVDLIDFQWDENYIYLIMEYCKGGDLNKFIRSKRALPEHFVKRFFQQIVKAFKFLRDSSVAHMDLKPQNILLSSPKSPVLKIADFGFARHLFHGDELHALRGSPLYMAPEIICKQTYDSRVDLWSIGVILYECLFGKPPFASKTMAELEEKIRDTRPIEIPYGVEVSDSCRDLLLGLLQRDPEKRITFEDFFNHPFVDLVHIPSHTSLYTATELAKEAVRKDQSGDFKAAIQLYSESLSHFVPAIHYEKNQVKKDHIRTKVKSYMDRAEELKIMLRPNKHILETAQMSDSSDSIQILMELWKDDVEAKAALTVIKGADVECESEDYESAFRHYEMGLSTLIDKIKDEPKGKRKDITSRQVKTWMTQAEKIKEFISVQTLQTNDTSTQEEKKDQEIINKEQCMVQ